MRRGIIYQMRIPHRESLSIRGFEFGGEGGEHSCAIIGSLRGNEVQQAFVCATLVSLLERVERSGGIVGNKSILVVPCANPLSMNVRERFWPGDRADINRSFPGDEHGRSTERIAAALMRVARLFTYGIQLCSFNQPGDFLPHVRITRQGPISDESLEYAEDFELPYTVCHEPTSFDTTTLNYVCQQCGIHAFSLYSRATDRIDTASAKVVSDAVLRFLVARGIIQLGDRDAIDIATAERTRALHETDLVDVRTQRSAGFFVPAVSVGDYVQRGQRLGAVLNTGDARLLETLTTPRAGRVFFMRTDPLIQQHMVALRIAP